MRKRNRHFIVQGKHRKTPCAPERMQCKESDELDEVRSLLLDRRGHLHERSGTQHPRVYTFTFTSDSQEGKTRLNKTLPHDSIGPVAMPAGMSRPGSISALPAGT